MDCFLPVVVANISANLLLAFVFGFLYLTRRQDSFLFWCTAWGLHSIRFFFEPAFESHPGSLQWLLPVLLILILNGLLLLKGTYRFLKRPIPSFWYIAAALTLAHLTVRLFIPMRQIILILPIFLFSGALLFWTGITVLRSDERRSVGRWMAAGALILWGIHRASYPFIRPIDWLAPWGYLIASILTLMIALGMIILSFERAHRELEENRELLQEIIENTQEVFWVFDPYARKTLYLSPRYDDIFGRAGESVRLNPTVFYQMIHPEDRSACRSFSLEPAGTERETREASFRFLRPDGEERWLRARVFPFRRSRDGRHLIIGVGEDVTERKSIELRLAASVAEKDLLLREIHHRVKNNLQIVSSLLNIHQNDFEHSQDREIYTRTQNRIRTIALLHESLYQSKSLETIDMSRYILQLKDFLAVSAGLEPHRVRFKLDIEPMEMCIDQASPVALIMNELITNSLKHAFSGGAAGTIAIVLKRQGEKRALLSISDNGVGFREEDIPTEDRGFGLQLVTSLSRQLDGTLEIRSDHGFRAEIEFPLSFREE